MGYVLFVLFLIKVIYGIMKERSDKKYIQQHTVVIKEKE